VAPPTRIVLGVDGWRGAWVAASVEVGSPGARLLRWHAGRFADLPLAAAHVVGVDVPIGQPTTGRRTCDLLARSRLPGAAARVFLTPPRGAFQAATLAEANRLLRAAGESAISAQTFALRAAVAEVAAWAADPRVEEVHPELSFAALAGRPLPPKRSARGVAARIAALAGWLDVVAALAEAPPGVPVDDALDALACAWTAHRVDGGAADLLGGDPDPDGRPMRIAV